MTQPTDEAAVEQLARDIMIEDVCGLTLPDGERVFCNDPRILEDHRHDNCECMDAARACIVPDWAVARALEVMGITRSNPGYAKRHYTEHQTVFAVAREITAATRRAEQAERMLAEAVRELDEISKRSPNEGGCYYSNRMSIFGARRTLTTIRSAASGEQG